MPYRTLTRPEIQTLEQQGCQAEKWEQVTVSPDFTPANIQQVTFRGVVQLGRFSTPLEIEPGVVKSAGLYRSFIQDCTIADDVYLADVKTLVGYNIGSQAAIENVGALVVTGISTFGNGTQIEVLNEGGGRELIIFDRLTAQIAYLLVTYRHDPPLIQALKGLIADYVATKKAKIGQIGAGARVLHCGVLRNLNIGPAARLVQAQLLEDGTIGSRVADPTIVGAGVIAKNFIIQSGSHVESGAILTHCFVGQGVRMGKQFSAENSAFFANAEGFHGEACSVFAGPYTVTHHKSTLLIAGLFSFYNAGSGTNQSNHMYKLGPLHQGILERGVKTGSFAYLLWPARIGAFTAVIGKHASNFDTSDFPFSYIMEDHGKSVLAPAMNLFTVGTTRDSAKWPARDRRRDPEKFDLINFELFGPYTMSKVCRALEILKKLYENAAPEQEYVTYQGIQIKRLMLKNCGKYYELALKVFLGTQISQKLQPLTGIDKFQEVLAQLQPADRAGAGKWLDLAGLLTPTTALEPWLAKLRQGEIKDIHALAAALKTLYERYAEFAWSWCVALLEPRLALPFTQITPTYLIELLKAGKENQVKLNNMILKDAEKEFDPLSRIGFGIDGDEATRVQDFTAVRGTWEQNKFVQEIKARSAQTEAQTAALIAWLEKMQ